MLTVEVSGFSIGLSTAPCTHVDALDHFKVLLSECCMWQSQKLLLIILQETETWSAPCPRSQVDAVGQPGSAGWGWSSHGSCAASSGHYTHTVSLWCGWLRFHVIVLLTLIWLFMY